MIILKYKTFNVVLLIPTYYKRYYLIITFEILLEMEFIPRRARLYQDFIVDHPFMFFILTRSNTIIFVGRMTTIID